MRLGMIRSRRAIALLAVAAIAGMATLPAAASHSRAALSARGSAAIPLLRVGLEYPIATLDQTQSVSALNGTLFLSLEQLVQLGRDRKPHPWLARSVTQPNPTTYVYRMRPGVKFWNGHPVTAADAADSLNYWRLTKGSQASFLFGTVKSIKAVGRDKVVVTLLHPDATWPVHLAAAPGVFESAFRKQHTASFGKPGTLIMATGPWQPVSLDPNAGEELAANPHYWRGPVNIQHISIKFFQSETSMAVAYRTGGIDLAFPFDGHAFGSTSKAKMTYTPSITPLHVSLDVIAAPWDDIHVRKAVAWALNRRDIARALAQPSQPLSTFIPPSELYDLAPRSEVDAVLKKVPRYSFNLARAKQEMAKSKHPDGFTADLKTLRGFGFYNMAQVVAANLKEIGIKLNIKILTLDQWAALVTGADRKAVGLQLITPTSGTVDASDLPSFNLGSVNAKAGGFNDSNWAPPDVDKLIKAGVGTTDGRKRLAIYGKILQRVAQDVPYVPILLTTQAVAVSPKFKWPTFAFFYPITPWALEVKPA